MPRQVKGVKNESGGETTVHADRPLHVTETHMPGGRVHLTISVASARLRLTDWCKYCDRTHADWWSMPDPRDGEIMLCGKCGFTSQRAEEAAGGEEPPF